MKEIKVFALIVFVSALMIFVLTFKSKDNTYELITNDNIAVVIEGYCEAAQTFVKCNEIYYYDIKEFREIK